MTLPAKNCYIQINKSLLILIIGLMGSIISCKKTDDLPSCTSLEELKINQIQIIASHNSYRLHTYDTLYKKLIQLAPIFGFPFDPSELDYTHLPIPEQLSTYHVRGLELDVYHDPSGGRFLNRAGNLLVGEPTLVDIPALASPGMKVLHIPDIDYMTNYYTFVEALTALKVWSEAHPSHLPIFVQVETKSESLQDYVTLGGLTSTLPFTAGAGDTLDMEIKSVFGNNLEKVITPDDIRGNYTTLNEAVRAGNFPTIAEARGKVCFIIDKGNYGFYADGHPSLAGRAMFVYAEPRSPECAFIIANDAISQKDSITQWVSEGYIIRTRTDSGTVEARTGDYSKRDAAFASGAQIISTDYYRPDPRHDTSATWTDFSVFFPDGSMARYNPINTDSTAVIDCNLAY